MANSTVWNEAHWGSASPPKSRRRVHWQSTTLVDCPFCGQQDQLVVDLGGGEEQLYSEDCSVCCRPRLVHVEPTVEQGEPRVWVERDE
jgi:Cysteine-rich CPXCG